MTRHRQTPEPRTSIYRPQWHEAQARLAQLEPPAKELFVRLLEHVESGWTTGVRELQLLYEQNAHLELAGGPTADILAFIDGDVVDVYRTVANGAAKLIPVVDGVPEAADPGDLEGDAFLFMRYVGVLRLAAQSPECIIQGVEEICTSLVNWYGELSELLRVIDEEVILPALPPHPWDGQ